MKVHKVTVLVVDHDDLGAEDVQIEMETVRYPNHCMYPRVMEMQTVEVDWSDDHPLNKRDTWREEFKRLFG